MTHAARFYATHSKGNDHHGNQRLRFFAHQKINLSHRLVDYFVQEIESGRFPIGERLMDELSLAKMLNVSRNVLRESMKVLENHGILQTVNGKDTIVSENAMANIQGMRFFEKLRNDTTALQFLDARRIIEPEIAYEACRRCTEKDLAALRSILDMPFDAQSGEPDNCDFHLAIASICGNEVLTEFLRTIICHLREEDYAQFNCHVEALLHDNSRQEHEQIYQAFADHDPAQAFRAAQAHICNRINIIRTLYTPDIDVQTLEKDDLIVAMRPEGSKS